MPPFPLVPFVIHPWLPSDGGERADKPDSVVRDHSTDAAYPRAWTGRPRAPPYLALLRSGFTEPIRSPGSLVVSYTTVSPLPVPVYRVIGGLLSAALSLGSPPLGFPQ